MTRDLLSAHCRPVCGPIDAVDVPTRVEVRLRVATPARARRIAAVWLSRFYWAKNVHAEGRNIIVYEKAEYIDHMIEELLWRWPNGAEVVP